MDAGRRAVMVAERARRRLQETERAAERARWATEVDAGHRAVTAAERARRLTLQEGMMHGGGTYGNGLDERPWVRRVVAAAAAVPRGLQSTGDCAHPPQIPGVDPGGARRHRGQVFFNIHVSGTPK